MKTVPIITAYSIMFEILEDVWTGQRLSGLLVKIENFL